MVSENIKYYVVLERHPMQVGFPKELQFSKYWYACLNKVRGLDWTDDITEAQVFDTPEAAVEFMSSGMFSKQFMAPIPGFSCHVVLSRKSVSPLFNLAEAKKKMIYDDLEDWLDENDPTQTAKLLEAIKQAIKQIASVDKPQKPAIVVADSLNGVEPCEDCGCKLYETYLGGDVPKRSHVCCVRCGTKRKAMSVDHQHTYHHALRKFAESSIKFHQALKDSGIPFESIDGSTTITATP